MAVDYPPHLRVVPDRPQSNIRNDLNLSAHSSRRSLFIDQSPSLLIFVTLDKLSDDEFYKLLSLSKPKKIIDIRIVPTFNSGSMSRKKIFGLFSEIAAEYYDFCGITGIKQANDARLNPRLLGQDLIGRVFRQSAQTLGPIVILTDQDQAQHEFIDGLAQSLDSLMHGGWETMRFPEVISAKPKSDRSLIFISHAAPDDNEFSKWLGSQLTLAGYEVWADYDRLMGGELFWDTIEEVIRNRALKVIVAASRLAQTRSGVLDEISLAINVEKSQNLKNFVLPLKIDDLPYTEFRANLSRRDIINFHGNWAAGLSSLLRAFALDNVPQGEGDSRGLAQIVHRRVNTMDVVSDTPDQILLNWIPIVALPNAVGAFEFGGPAGKLQAVLKTLGFPAVEYESSIISFAQVHEVQRAMPPSISARRRSATLTSEFLSGRAPEFPRLSHGEARRLTSNLVRQGWELHCRRRNLLPFQLASGWNAWFLAEGAIPGNKVHYLDAAGIKRRKSLVGFSAKRGVFWHFALEMRPTIGGAQRFSARPHVIFSTDGKTPLASSARMHALRRGFCKTWWNDRWRDLTVAYVAHLADSESTFEIDMGGVPMIVSGRLIDVVCPVSPIEAVLPIVLSEASDWDDDLEDADLDEEEIELLTPREGADVLETE